MTIEEYIEALLPETIRYNPEDNGSLIGLPKPYSVPCAKGTFQEMYYWDTYFTNKGFIARGDIEQAKNNVENMLFLVEKYGYMPNGNKVWYLNNSQPPFLSMMVRDCFEATKDKAWLKTVFSGLKKEYLFWQENRALDMGLNAYNCVILPNPKGSADYFVSRIGFRPEGRTDDELGLASKSACECGWDMNPRTSWKTYEYAAVDLNSLLFAMEENLAYFAEILGEDSSFFKQRAEKRAELCRKYMLDENDLYFDYNAVEKEKQTIFSAASYYPLYCKMANMKEANAAKKALNRLETEYGILTCERNAVEGTYQWDYPNGWAPLQLMVAGGLKNYGFTEDALRIAEKYVRLVEKSFEETGNMWEKYNVVLGSSEALNEYEMPPMLGWTFGVYTEFKKWLKENK